MAAGITLDGLAAWLTRFRELVTEQREALTDLDSAIGDADHGANMARGMAAVTDKLASTPAEAADGLLKTVGMTLVSSVGGSSGPLYGTFFLRMGTSAGAADGLDADAMSAAMHAGVDGIVARGRAEPGDKTMLDAFVPALRAFDGAKGDGVAAAARAAAVAADEGRDATAPLQARKGRASYLGERSIGHVDPGAASAALLFHALADTVQPLWDPADSAEAGRPAGSVPAEQADPAAP